MDSPCDPNSQIFIRPTFIRSFAVERSHLSKPRRSGAKDLFIISSPSVLGPMVEEEEEEEKKNTIRKSPPQKQGIVSWRCTQDFAANSMRLFLAPTQRHFQPSCLIVPFSLGVVNMQNVDGSSAADVFRNLGTSHLSGNFITRWYWVWLKASTFV